MGSDQYQAEDISVEAQQAHAESVRYIAQTFLDEKHYQKLYTTLAQKWDRLHSLSAAVRLMQTYGVELTDEEMSSLSHMDEGQQINALVSKMPKQSNDQFQHFFLQLQLLVSTAMRVRRALEEGRPEEVAQALEDADSTGIATYILRVAVVQAGNEVLTLKTQYEAWIKEADYKLGRLLRGQQDAFSAQKKLAAAEAELNKRTTIANAKAAKVVLSFAQGDDRALSGIVLSGWVSATKVLAMERQLEEEYKTRLLTCETRLAEFKERQILKGSNMMLRKIHDEQAMLLENVFVLWRHESEEAKFLRESGDKVTALTEKIERAKAVQRDNAKKVLSSFSTASDSALMGLVFKSWFDSLKEAHVQKTLEEEQALFNQRMSKMDARKAETTKLIMSMVAGSSDTGLLSTILQAWVKFVESAHKEKKILDELKVKKEKLKAFAEMNKNAAFSAVSRAAQTLEATTMLRHFGAWRTWAKMECVMRKHYALIDAKRQQLVGVQQMFRDFAKQLEGGVKETGPNTRFFDTGGQRTPGKSDSRRLHKTEATTSLPDIHKGSGCRQKEALPSPPRSGHKDYVPHPQGPEFSPGRQGPRAAWAA